MRITNNNYSVTYSNSYWQVKRDLDPFAQGTFISKAEAVGYGTLMARTAYCLLKIYKMNGILQDINDYREYRGPNYYE